MRARASDHRSHELYFQDIQFQYKLKIATIQNLASFMRTFHDRAIHKNSVVISQSPTH